MKKLLAVLFITIITGVCHAGEKQEVRFQKGSSSATIDGSVIRGERDWYYLTAKAGQTMSVEITSVEDNAVFQIYQPGYKVSEVDGFTEIEGPTLPGADETSDAKTWTGALPASGKYLFVVGGTRGNADYQLKVSIH